MARITTDQVAELIAQDKAGRVTKENLQEFLKNPEKIFAVIATVVVSVWQILYDACRQDWKDSNINEKNFPLLDDGTVHPVEEYCLGHNVASGKQAEKELKKLGFKLVGMKRAMEYIVAHLNSQLDHPVVVLGAQWQYPLDRVYVPCFYWDEDGRSLLLRWTAREFNSDCRFLVSRE
jgi:hypothetical protein